MYRGYVYFDTVRPNIIYQALNCIKIHNKFYENISISEGLLSIEMINFSSIDKNQDVAESIYKQISSDETEYGSVEDALSIHKTESN